MPIGVGWLIAILVLIAVMCLACLAIIKMSDTLVTKTSEVVASILVILVSVFIGYQFVYQDYYLKSHHHWDVLSQNLEGKRVVELTLVYPFGDVDNGESEDIQSTFDQLAAKDVPVELHGGHRTKGCILYIQVAEPFSETWTTPLHDALSNVFSCETIYIRRWVHEP